MTQSTPATEKLENEIRDAVAELTKLRDEIRLKAHLLGMDARSRWHALEKQFELLEERFGHGGDHVATATRELAQELRQAFRDFKQTVI
jgi:hypothetical protein